MGGPEEREVDAVRIQCELSGLSCHVHSGDKGLLLEPLGAGREEWWPEPAYLRLVGRLRRRPNSFRFQCSKPAEDLTMEDALNADIPTEEKCRVCKKSVAELIGKEDGSLLKPCDCAEKWVHRECANRLIGRELYHLWEVEAFRCQCG